MSTADYIPLSVRCFAPPEEWVPSMRELPSGRWQDGYQLALVYDTETTVDRYQSLLVGTYLLCRIDWSRAGPTVVPLEEGLFAPDDLRQADPAAWRRLRQYVQRHQRNPGVSLEEPDAAVYLRLLTRRQFCELRFQVAYRHRGLIVGFNLPFDESRIAVDWRPPRSRGFERGFGLIHHTYTGDDGEARESLHRPRTLIAALDSKRARVRFTKPAKSDVEHTPGMFLDLRQFLFALTGKGHGLESGCEAFGVPCDKDAPELGVLNAALIHYGRRDTAATMRLLEAALAEYHRRNVRLPAHYAYSAASLGKAALKQMGIRPILERQPDFPHDLLGAAMVGFYGGRAECRIRCTAVPIVLVDYLSNYATVCCLIGAWDYFTHQRIDTTEVDPAEIEAWLEKLTLDQLYDRATWRDLNVLCWVVPGDENILPVRGRYDPTGQSDSIAVTPVTLSEPVPWMLADLAASKTLSGHHARVVRAVRLEPGGDRLPGLRKLQIPGAGVIDPRHHDYFQRLVELRAKAKTDPSLDETTRRWVRQSLKTTVNATAYGINAEMNPQPRTKPATVQAAGLEEFTTKPKRPEVPGEYCFPPLAAMITAGARLLLAMLEAEVSRRAGSYTFCDTDSMAIVATRLGGLIPCQGGPEIDEQGRACVRALTYAQVEEIIARFERLNPYNRKIIPGSILEIDDASLDHNDAIRELWAWSIAAKRYATFTWQDCRPVLAEKYSEHGTGHLSDPRDPRPGGHKRPFVAELWQHILDAELGDPPDDPEWFQRPAVTQRSISTPHILELLDPDHELRPYGFCNHVILHPDEARVAARQRFDLVAPYERAPRRWSAMDWLDVETGRTWSVTTHAFAGADTIRVKSIREVVLLYRRKREAKSVGPGGEPCTRETIGLLRRRPVRDLTLRHIGKEARQLEDLVAGLRSWDDVTEAYIYAGRGAYRQLVFPILLAFPQRVVAQATGLPIGTVNGLRSGREPSIIAHRLLVSGLVAPCLAQMSSLEQRPSDPYSTYARFRDQRLGYRRCPTCSAVVTGRRRYCGSACRQAAHRNRATRQTVDPDSSPRR
jgi:hypothetical protein